MINNNTLTGIADLIVGTSAPIPSHLALSSTSVTFTPTDTTLSGEFGTRISLSKNRSGTVAKFSATRIASSSTSTPINSLAIFTSITSGNIWAGMLVPSLIQTTNFDVDFEMWINMNGV